MLRKGDVSPVNEGVFLFHAIIITISKGSLQNISEFLINKHAKKNEG